MKTDAESPAASSASAIRPLAAFEQFSLFQGVPQEVLLVIFVAARECLVRKGDVVVREGDPGEELYIIGAGSAEVVLGHETTDARTIATLHAGDCFGEMCIIEPTRRSASVVAMEPMMLYGLSSATLNKVYHFWPQQQSVIMANLAKTLAIRVHARDPLFADRAY
jgi:CRP/FNR family transcriptional regulator, cyclic AMP receptor protein